MADPRAAECSSPALLLLRPLHSPLPLLPGDLAPAPQPAPPCHLDTPSPRVAVGRMPSWGPLQSGPGAGRPHPRGELQPFHSTRALDSLQPRGGWGRAEAIQGGRAAGPPQHCGWVQLGMQGHQAGRTGPSRGHRGVLARSWFPSRGTGPGRAQSERIRQRCSPSSHWALALPPGEARARGQ